MIQSAAIASWLIKLKVNNMEEKIVKITVNALDSKKALNIKVLKIEELSSIADYFVIANGTSSTQIKALADEVEFKLEQEGIRIGHREGYADGRWVLLDYGPVIVHIFHPEAREFYNLEKLWADANEVDAQQYIEIK